MAPVPPGIRFLTSFNRDQWYRAFTFVLTFLLYTSFHLSRKPISIVKSELHKNCSVSSLEFPDDSSDRPPSLSLSRISAEREVPGVNPAPGRKGDYAHANPSANANRKGANANANANAERQAEGGGAKAKSRTRRGADSRGAGTQMSLSQNSADCSWKPFDKSNYKELLGAMDYSFLCAYAIGMYLSGIIGERLPIRLYLSVGMVTSGIFTCLFGLGYIYNIHSLSFYITIQVCNGLVQTTGWPSVVTCIGNWFGKGRRGLIMGVWNSHTSVGNILGSLIAGCFVSSNWGLSFIVPGIIIIVMGIVCFLFLIEHPNDLKGISTHTSAQNNTKLQKSWNGRNGQYKPGKTQSWDTELLLPSSGDGGDRSVCVPVQQLVVVKSDTEPSAISFMGALRIPGVVEFSLCLLFAKLVSYTFLFWLPMYITKAAHLDAKRAGDLSTLFDVGGIVGGILAGVVSDKMGKRATTCAVMLLLAAPTLYVFSMISELGLGPTIVMLLVCGGLVNGPYALITTAVSADLGTHKSLKGNARALSTVTAIIDGTGSVGAAVGPLLAGLLSARGWQHVFYMLMTADFLALLLLLRLVMKELRSRKNRSPSVTVELKEH